MIQAKNGQEALDIVKKKHLDLIILDLDLPDISGLEVCRLIRDDLSNTVKILILSAMGKGSVVSEGFTNGADDYMIKQIDLDRLRMKISRLLETETAC